MNFSMSSAISIIFIQHFSLLSAVYHGVRQSRRIEFRSEINYTREIGVKKSVLAITFLWRAIVSAELSREYGIYVHGTVAIGSDPMLFIYSART